MKMARRQPVQWRRTYWQTLTLMHKNFLIFYTSPISTTFRALIFPLVAALVLCYLKYIHGGSNFWTDVGFANTSNTIMDLSKAMGQLGRSKLIFVANGTALDIVNPIVDSVARLPGMDRMNLLTVEKPSDLFDTCKQSLTGRSDCYAAVVFISNNETDVEYAIAMDQAYTNGYWWGDWKNGNDILNNFIFPLQWVMDSQIGKFPSDTARPSTRTFKGEFGFHAYKPPGDELGIQGGSTFWVSLVAMFVGPIFILLLIGVVYHLAVFVATERETSMVELMGSQQVTIIPRLLSTMLSFFAVYFPGFLFCSIVMTQVLFIKTSDILMTFLTLLAGLLFIASTHFMASVKQ